MHQREGSFRTVLADPNLRRIELAFLGFNMTEFATWIAILVYAFERGGAAAMGAVSAILLASYLSRATLLYGTIGGVVGLLVFLRLASGLFVSGAELSAVVLERRAGPPSSATD